MGPLIIYDEIFDELGEIIALKPEYEVSQIGVYLSNTGYSHR